MLGPIVMRNGTAEIDESLASKGRARGRFCFLVKVTFVWYAKGKDKQPTRPRS